MHLSPYHFKNRLEAGCDEVGRGCLAGPVVAAAVILPSDIAIPELSDSKLLSEKKRYQLRTIIQQTAVSYAIAEVDNASIDKLNILQATFRAMHLAIDQLEPQPEHLLIDGNRFLPYKNIPHLCIIKGDNRYASIAAASILAKTYRDDLMNLWHEKFPHYGWNTNKGYPTKSHRTAILKYGTTSLHRMSFTLLKKQ